MLREQFVHLVAEAVEALPEEFQARLENIDVVVEDVPSSEQMGKTGVGGGSSLLGLYEGTPLTQRNSGYSMVPPDKITIFQSTIEARCSSETEIKNEIKSVVRHEIAHHFGIDDAYLSQIERSKNKLSKRRDL